MNKKLISWLLALGLVANVVLTAAPVVKAAYDAEYLAAFDWAKSEGITSMPSADDFKPRDLANRQEWAKFASNFGEKFLCLEENPAAVCDFSDEATFSPALASSVEKACKLGLMRWDDGKFYANVPVTKSQVLATLVRGMADYMDEAQMPRYKAYHTWAYDRGLTTVSDVYSFDRPVTRYEALLMLYRSRGYDCDTGILTPSTGTNTGTVVTNGEITISRNDSTLDNIYTPGTSTNVKIMALDLRAGAKGGSVRSIKFKLLPTLGSRTNIKGISITDENRVRISNVPVFNSTDEATVVLNTTNGLTLEPNTTKTVLVMVDLSGSVNEILQFSIMDVASVTSVNSTVGGSFPIVSSVVNTTQYAAQTLNFRGVEAAQVTPTNQIAVGDTNKDVARFTLETASNSSRDVWVKNITFRATDNMDGILGNLKLQVSTGTVSAKAIVDGRYVTFVFDGDGYLMPRGTSRVFYVKADVIGGDTNDNIQLFLDEPRDVVAIEEGTNAAVNLVATDRYFGTNYSYKITAGRTQITRTDLLYNTNIARDVDGIKVLEANFNAKAPINVEKVRVFAMQNGVAGCNVATANADFDRVRLYINGMFVDEDSSVNNPSAITNCTYEFSFYGTLNAGPNKIEVLVDTKTANLNNYYYFTLDKNSVVFGSNAEYTANGDSVQLADVNGLAQGATFIIKDAAVDNISITNPANPQVEVVGTDVVAAKFAVRASNVVDILLNGFTLNLTNPASNAGYVGVATVYVGTSAIATEDFGASNSVTFNSNLNILIPAGQSKEVTVKVHTYDTLPTAGVAPNYDLRFSVNGWNIVNATNGQPVSYTNTLVANPIDLRGALNVDGNLSNSVASTILPDSATEFVRVWAFTLRTDYDNATVREVTLANLGSTFASTTVDGSTLGCAGASPTYTTPCTNTTNSSDGVVVELRNGADVVGNGQIINGIAYVVLTSPVTITSSASKTFDVYVKGNSTINSAAETNKVIKLGLLNAGETVSFAGGSAQTLITPASSTVAVSSTFNNVILNGHYIRDTKLSVAGTNTTAWLLTATPGQTLFKTDLVVDTAGEAYLGKFAVSVTSNAGAPTFSNLKLKIDNVELNAADVTFTPSATSIVVELAGGYANGYTLNPGTHSVEIVGQIDGVSLTSTATEILTFYIPEVATMASCTTVQPLASWTASTVAWANNGSIIWSDGAHNTYSTLAATADWFNDCAVEQLNSNYYKLQD